MFEAKRSNVPRVIQLRNRSARNSTGILISTFKLLNCTLFCLMKHYTCQANFLKNQITSNALFINCRSSSFFTFVVSLLPFLQYMAENLRQFFELGNSKVRGLKILAQNSEYVSSRPESVID